MKVLVGYTSTDGQTRKIARHVADRLADTGHGVELLALADATDLDMTRFDRAILAASVHIGSYQRPLSKFIDANRRWLNANPALFPSVSLSAAGHEAEEWRGLDRIWADFQEATGWKPGKVAQIAGAYRPSQYDVFRRFVMRRILAAKDPDADPDQDREYTDWEALDTTVDEWLAA